MLTLLNISNIALIDELQVEFDKGLNLLTGETGSGKSIIVDALGVLIGGRFTSDLVKAGETRAFIEGFFSVEPNTALEGLLNSAGIEVDSGEGNEILIRRELAAGGRSKIFINHQLATQSLLRDLRPFLVDIHGQGDQQTLFNPETHLELLDAYAGLASPRQEVSSLYKRWGAIRREMDDHRQDEAERFQLIDILRFQIEELERAGLVAGEDERLEEERRRLMNVEKLTTLCAESFSLIYEDNDSAISRTGAATRRVEELGEYESSFRGYLEGLESARAMLEDLAFSLRDFADKLEFSPERLAEVESRLAEISRLKRKYGGSVESALEHLARSQDRLRHIERSDEREKELRAQLQAARADYLKAARSLRQERSLAARRFEREVERSLAEVALENGRFQVQMTSLTDDAQGGADAERAFSSRGIDRLEFYFSANVGESVRPLAKVASGGEASRLMLVLKTIVGASEFPRTIVFDEIDTGIGGRVSEAVGVKLKKLSETNQVFCVTHQPQIARFANAHLLVRKEVVSGRTQVLVDKLDRRARVEEIARMLTGSEITETARRHAREMLKSV
ncbi:MAG TPA: DNA repair protein RecN [Blastocatellia bacterium]|jgi:DNA repair protein RecN (Recombination protein N)|nr:DNA repair protein RecN [Blastocatellia bacterium]